MWSWLTSPPVLLAGFLASLCALTQPFRVLTRKIVLFPRLMVELAIGRWFLQAITGGKPATPPAGQDWSKYRA
jgi:hypothetical protein